MKRLRVLRRFSLAGALLVVAPLHSGCSDARLPLEARLLSGHDETREKAIEDLRPFDLSGFSLLLSAARQAWHLAGEPEITPEHEPHTPKAKRMPETLLDLAFAAAEAASAVGPAAIDVWAAFCRESGIHRAIGTTPLEQHGDDSVGDLLIEEWRRGELPSHFFAVSRFPETIVGVLPDFDAILGGALALSEQDEIVGSPPVPEATKTRLVEEALLTYPFYEWLAREQEKGGLPREWNFRPRVFMEAFREGILPFAKSQLRRTEVLESMLNSGINWLQVDACFWARSNGYWVNIQGSEVDCQVLAASTGVISITNR